MADDKGYPYDVPYDDELFFYNGATLRVPAKQYRSILKARHARPNAVLSAIIPSMCAWSLRLATTIFVMSATKKTHTRAVFVAVLTARSTASTIMPKCLVVTPFATKSLNRKTNYTSTSVSTNCSKTNDRSAIILLLKTYPVTNIILICSCAIDNHAKQFFLISLTIFLK